jgi:hypothetical protein
MLLSLFAALGGRFMLLALEVGGARLCSLLYYRAIVMVLSSDDYGIIE